MRINRSDRPTADTASDRIRRNRRAYDPKEVTPAYVICVRIAFALATIVAIVEIARIAA